MNFRVKRSVILSQLDFIFEFIVNLPVKKGQNSSKKKRLYRHRGKFAFKRHYEAN